MKPLQLAVVGFGRVGRVCAELILRSQDLSLAAIVRRAVSASGTLPETLRSVPVATHIGQVKHVDAALLCVPANVVEELAAQVLQHGIPVVDCVMLHGAALEAHHTVIHKAAVHHRAAAIVGAGWDPGALSVFRSWLALLTPGGMTETRRHTGISLRHTTMAQNVRGVKDALCAEVQAPDGRLQRYVYVELENREDADSIAQAIRADPLFLGEDTQVFPVDSLAALEEEGRGVVLDRRGAPGRFGHQHLVLEARCDDSVLTAQVMLAAARALPQLKPGSYLLSQVPLSALWGERAEKAQREWS